MREVVGITGKMSFLGLLVGGLIGSAVSAGPAAGADRDGNGLDDELEVALAEKFRPVLILAAGDHPGMKPCPVGILGDGGDLTADKLWARVYNGTGQLVTIARTVDTGWNPAPPFSSSGFNYSGFGWDQNAIPYIGSPPDAAFSIYYVRLYPDYGGPDTNCPGEWESLFDGGDGFHPPGSSLEPTAYAHLFRDGSAVILQYWFFYPWNDWVNNHEGDWEHFHLKLSSADPDSAEITGACFYFHLRHLDLSPPSLLVADESHPVVWIGGHGEWSCNGCDGNGCAGDGNGGDASHGCYPAFGVWEDVGAYVPGCGRADESIGRCGSYHHWKDLRIEVLPDPGAIDYGEQPGLSWHGARIPFGPPFVPSYCDGTCEFFDDFPLTSWLVEECGNGAPAGPGLRATWSLFSGGSVEGAWTGQAPSLPGPAVLDVPGMFPGIGDAAGCALPGDTILVAPGVYGGSVLLPGEITVLSDAGTASTFWTAPSFGRAVRVRAGARGVRIGDDGRGFTFDREGGLFFPAEYVVLSGEGEERVRGNRFAGPALFRAVRLQDGRGVARIESNRFSTQYCALSAALAGTQGLIVGGGPDRVNDFTHDPGGTTIELFCDSCVEVDARFNYWGTVEPEEIIGGFAGAVESIDFEPWTDSTHEEAYYLESVAIPETPEAAGALRFESEGTNPVTGEITLRYYLPGEGRETRIRVYDVRGRVVRNLLDRRPPRGEGSLVWKTAGLESGVYFVRIESAGRSAVRKLVLIR